MKLSLQCKVGRAIRAIGGLQGPLRDTQGGLFISINECTIFCSIGGMWVLTWF